MTFWAVVTDYVIRLERPSLEVAPTALATFFLL